MTNQVLFNREKVAVVVVQVNLNLAMIKLKTLDYKLF